MSEHSHSADSQHDGCGDTPGEHACGGGGSADGVCQHEDGTSHACCQAEEATLVMDASLSASS
ncbi:MAG: hypothetical protein HQ478_07525 [Chloroflexi bacterium]|nr:hypothetical protein [Chloroflexota bacterium]